MNEYECLSICVIVAGPVLLCAGLLAKTCYEDYLKYKLKELEKQKEVKREDRGKTAVRRLDQ